MNEEEEIRALRKPQSHAREDLLLSRHPFCGQLPKVLILRTETNVRHDGTHRPLRTASEGKRKPLHRRNSFSVPFPKKETSAVAAAAFDGWRQSGFDPVQEAKSKHLGWGVWTLRAGSGP